MNRLLFFWKTKNKIPSFWNGYGRLGAKLAIAPSHFPKKKDFRFFRKIMENRNLSAVSRYDEAGGAIGLSENDKKKDCFRE
jgi:hypothetical protein